MGFDFNKVLDYINFLEETGAEILIFEEYQVGIDDDNNCYVDTLLISIEGNIIPFEIVNENDRDVFKKVVADYFLD